MNGLVLNLSRHISYYPIHSNFHYWVSISNESYERPIEPKQLTLPAMRIGVCSHNVKFSSTLGDFVEYAYGKGCHLLIPNHTSFLTIFQKLYFLFHLLKFFKPLYPWQFRKMRKLFNKNSINLFLKILYSFSLSLSI